MLEVAVHQDHGIAAGNLQAGANGAFLAEIAGQGDGAQLGHLGGQLFQHLPGIVGRTVVDDDDLERHGEPAHLVADRLQAVAQVIGLAIGRQHHGEDRQGGHSAASPGRVPT